MDPTELRAAIAASILRLSHRLNAHPYTEAEFPGMTKGQAQEASLNAWLDDMARGLAGITPEAFSKAVEDAFDGEIRFWNEFSPKWIKERSPATSESMQLHGAGLTESERERGFKIEREALLMYQSWRYKRIAALKESHHPADQAELKQLQEPTPALLAAKLAEFKPQVAAYLERVEAHPSEAVAKIAAVSIATRAAARFNSEQRNNVAALQSRLNLMPSYAPGELSPESEQELLEARASLQSQIASLQNPSPEFRAQRLEEISIEIQSQVEAQASSAGVFSVGEIKLRAIG